MTSGRHDAEHDVPVRAGGPAATQASPHTVPTTGVRSPSPEHFPHRSRAGRLALEVWLRWGITPGGDHDYVGIESVTVPEIVADCPFCSHPLPVADPWPTDCALCRAPHKVCSNCGAHIRWGGVGDPPTENPWGES